MNGLKVLSRKTISVTLPLTSQSLVIMEFTLSYEFCLLGTEPLTRPSDGLKV